MELLITVKSAERRKGYLTERAFQIPDSTDSLRQLIIELSHQLVLACHAQQLDPGILTVTMGRISFGRPGNNQQPDRQLSQQTLLQAQQQMLTAFADGLFRVFHNQQEVTELDVLLPLKNGDRLLFIRFIMLAGGLFPYLNEGASNHAREKREADQLPDIQILQPSLAANLWRTIVESTAGLLFRRLSAHYKRPFYHRI